LVCNDCLITEHKAGEHHYKGINEAEERMRQEVDGLVQEAHTKIDYCDQANNTLGTSLQELQSQHDTARGLINESYQSFKAVLERCRDNALNNLEKLHSERELKIMDLLHNVEQSVEKIDNACKFTEKVLGLANGAEMLCLKKIISSQFLNLFHSTPKVDVNFSLEFISKFDRFEKMSQELFGKLRTESTPPSPKESTPPPTLPGMPPMLKNNNSMMPNGSSQSILTGSVTASSPISLPTSMQSSFDGDISALGCGSNSGYMLSSHHMMAGPDSPSSQISSSIGSITAPPPPVPQIAPSSTTSASAMSGLTSIAEYNLQQLANLAESNDVSTDITDSILQTTGANSSVPPPTAFTLNDLISGEEHVLNNLQALAKLGLNGTGE
jgi:tripartite motif-containing protein 2/3